MSDDRIEYNESGDAKSFVGRSAVEVFAMAALASGLRLYAKTGMKPNHAWTPVSMMRAASLYLDGRTFKARDYIGAADALTQRVQEEKARLDKKE